MREIVNPSSPQTVTIPSQITVDGKQYTVTELKLGSNPPGWGGSHPKAENVTGLILPDTVTTVNGSSFQYFGLTSITIPGSIKSFDGSFQNCRTLTNVTFEEGMEYLDGSMIFERTGVEVVRLPSTVKGFYEGVFSYNEILKEVELSAHITTIPFATFSGCTALERVKANGVLTVIERSAFSRCVSLKEIPDLSHVVTMGDYAFSMDADEDEAQKHSVLKGLKVDLSSLKEIPNYAFTYAGVTITAISDELSAIGNWSLIECEVQPNAEGTLVLPETLQTISNYAFYNSPLPNKVVVPDSVTKVGIGAFQHAKVEEFDIGDGLKEFENNAFASKGLKKITVDNSADGISGTLPSGVTVEYTLPSIKDEGDTIAYGSDVTLQQAVNEAATEGEIITIQKDVTLGKTLRIPSGKHVTIRSQGGCNIVAKDTSLETLIIVEKGASVTFDGNVQLFGRRNSGAVIDCQGTVTIAGQARVFRSEPKSGSVIEVHGNGAKLVMTGGEVAENTIRHDGGAPICVSDGGKVSIQGGSIHDNKVVDGNYIDASSGIIINENAQAEMTGGAIENNVAYRGSAVALYSMKADKQAEFTMSGGVIRNNVCRSIHGDDPGSEPSGAVYVFGNALFTLKDQGLITKNTGGQGAGVTVVDPRVQTDHTNKGFPTKFIMEGGEISDNHANDGGGIYSFSNGVELKAGKICGNHANGKGGGIYSEGYEAKDGHFYNSTLHMTDAAIVNNTSNNQGGGLWFCSTGSATVYVANGAVIANNKAAGAGDDVISVKASAGMDSSITLANRMLGGGKVLWYQDGQIYRAADSLIYASTDKNAPRYGQAGAEGTPKTIEKNKEHLALKAIADASAVQLARNEATLLIENNSARSYGGGVAANGGIVIGEDKDLMDIPVEKTWDHGGNAESKRPVSVTVKLMRGQAVLDTLVLNEENGWKGVFEDLPQYDDYTVVEEPIPNYTVTVSGNAKDGFTLSNVYHPTEEDRPSIPQTGDDSPLLLWGVLLVLALGGVAYLVYRYKKGK